MVLKGERGQKDRCASGYPLAPDCLERVWDTLSAQVVEIMDYISCMYDCSSCTLSVQLYLEVRMDIMAYLLAAFGLDSFK
ncbi:hypothetical protein D3C80_1778770 [compost metagenome]